jgi:hypothetical protein
MHMEGRNMSSLEGRGRWTEITSKSEMTGVAALGCSERLTSQWHDVSADIIRFRPDNGTS